MHRVDRRVARSLSAGADAGDAVSVADGEPHAHRLRVCGRSVVGAARRWRCAATHQWRRGREQPDLLAGREYRRLHRRVRRQRGRLHRSGHRRGPDPNHLSPWSRSSRRLDARRSARALSIGALGVQQRAGAADRQPRRRVPRATAARRSLQRRLFSGWFASRLRADPARVHALETLSRRPDQPSGDRRAQRLERASDPARQLERLRADVDRRQSVFPLGPQRPGPPIQLRHEQPQSDADGGDRRPRHQIRVSRPRRDRLRAVRHPVSVRSRRPARASGRISRSPAICPRCGRG